MKESVEKNLPLNVDKTEAELNLESLQNNDSFQWNQNTPKFVFSQATWDPKFLRLNGLVEFDANYCNLLTENRNAHIRIHKIQNAIDTIVIRWTPWSKYRR